MFSGVHRRIGRRRKRILTNTFPTTTITATRKQIRTLDWSRRLEIGFEAGRGRDPRNVPEIVRQPESANGRAVDTAEFQRAQNLFRLHLFAAKSVSILAVTMNDQRIVEAHKEASSIAIRELEQFAATRIRKGALRTGTGQRAISWARPLSTPPTRSGTSIAHAFRRIQ